MGVSSKHPAQGVAEAAAAYVVSAPAVVLWALALVTIRLLAAAAQLVRRALRMRPPRRRPPSPRPATLRLAGGVTIVMRVPAGTAAVVQGRAEMTRGSQAPRPRHRLRRALAAAGFALAVIGAAAVSFAVALQLESSPAFEPIAKAPKPVTRDSVPIKAAWLTSAGMYEVERVPVAREAVPVDLDRAPAGIGHTTECSFECAMRVFRRRHAPNFLVGRDARGRVRIVQFIPLGTAAATSRNLPGGVETNRWARAQVEVVARSQQLAWVPDQGVLTAFSALLLELRRVAGIPLARPFIDAFAPEANAWRRRSGKWGTTAGWFNHGEVPENNHWDMGAFQWREAFSLAKRLALQPVAASAAGRSRATPFG